MDANVSRSEVELSVTWMEKHPDLAVKSILRFVEKHRADKVALDVRRAGFLTFIAVPVWEPEPRPL